MRRRIVQVQINAVIDEGRLIHKYPTGDENNECCIHGIKLRWSCEDCEEWIENNPEARKEGL